MAQDHRRAVSGDLDDVVHRVGVRLGKIADDDFIDGIVWRRCPRVFAHGRARLEASFLAGEGTRATWFHELSQRRSSGFEIMFQAQHGGSNGACLRASNTDHPNAAATRWGGDGDDGVVEVHSDLFLTRSGNGLPRGVVHGSFVVLWIHDHIPAKALGFALCTQIGMVA